MNRLALSILAAILAYSSLVADAAAAPNPKKLEECKELARQRGLTAHDKGANNMRTFVQACMQGKQK
jgi:hypothetical protein